MECFFGRLNTRLHANGVANVLMKFLVDLHQKINRANGVALQRFEVNRFEVALEQGRQSVRDEVGRKLERQSGAVGEWKFFGGWF